MNNFILRNRKGETKLSYLPIGRNKIVHQETNKNFLDEIVVSLFNYFLNPFPVHVYNM